MQPNNNRICPWQTQPPRNFFFPIPPPVVLQQRAEWLEREAIKHQKNFVETSKQLTDTINQLNKEKKAVAELEKQKKVVAAAMAALETSNKKLAKEKSDGTQRLMKLESENKKLRTELEAQKTRRSEKTSEPENQDRNRLLLSKYSAETLKNHKTIAALESELQKQLNRCMDLERNNNQLKKEMEEQKQSSDAAIQEAEASSRHWEAEASRFKILHRSASREKDMMQAEFDAAIQDREKLLAIFADFETNAQQFIQRVNAVRHQSSLALPSHSSACQDNDNNKHVINKSDATTQPTLGNLCNNKCNEPPKETVSKERQQSTILTNGSAVPSSSCLKTSKPAQKLMRRCIKIEPREEADDIDAEGTGSPILKKARKQLIHQMTEMIMKANCAAAAKNNNDHPTTSDRSA